MNKVIPNIKIKSCINLISIKKLKKIEIIISKTIP